MLALVAGPDTEVWNEGVGFYRDGDSTNALRVMRPLMASREYAARAAEIVAALTEDPEERARAAQIALRGGPDDERRRRNFSRATEGLAELRETKKLNALLAGAQGKDPAAMIRADAYATRRMMEESAGYLSITQVRDAKGRMSGREYIVRELVSAAPESGKPQAVPPQQSKIKEDKPAETNRKKVLSNKDIQEFFDKSRDMPRFMGRY